MCKSTEEWEGQNAAERDRGEGEVKDRGSENEEEAEEEGREGERKEGGRERSALARWFPTKQVRLHIGHDCIARSLLLTLIDTISHNIMCKMF